MRRRVILGVAVVLSVLSFSAHADQVRFTGRTTADATLIRDTLRNVLVIARARLNRSSTNLVTAEVLPPGYVPVGSKPEGSAKTTYERWTVALCGNDVPFLIAFWGAPAGGTMFRVGYPFPSSETSN